MRNFVLDGFDAIDLLDYRIRPLRNYEIRYLIGLGSYNQHTQRYPLWDIPDGLKGNLNPAYCVEVPPLVFGNNDENVSTEYIKNRLLGLLMTYKEGMVTMETELQYDIMSSASKRQIGMRNLRIARLRALSSSRLTFEYNLSYLDNLS